VAARARLHRAELRTTGPLGAQGRLHSAQLAAAPPVATARGRLHDVQLAAVKDTTRGRLHLVALAAVGTASAGDAATVEPWSTVTLTGTDSLPAGAARTWSQVSGAAVTLTSSGKTAQYEAPPAIAQQALVFRYDAGGVQAQVTHTVRPVTERVVRGGVEVPLHLIPVRT
jgi:hypothetical protein